MTNNTDDIQNNDTNQNQIESANDIKAVINPEIHNEIKLYIEKAHELTQENIGEDVSKEISKEMSTVHESVKEHAKNINQNITQQILEYTAIIFSLGAFGIIAYVIVRAHMDRARRNDASEVFQMTNQIQE